LIQSLVINVYQREKAIIKRQELKKPSHKMIQNRITRSDTGHHIIVLVHAWKEVLLRGFNYVQASDNLYVFGPGLEPGLEHI